MPAPDPDHLRDFNLAEAVVREAGTLARAHFSAMPESWNKSDSSPVSEADHAVNRLIEARLKQARPDYGWLSEETPDSDARMAAKEVWILDPIDGTRAFLKQRTDWVISLALAVDGTVIAGIVYNPLLEQMFAAVRGGGATLNGDPISVNRRTELNGIRLLSNPARFAPDIWRLPWPQMDIARQNAIAYRLAQVACGAADAAVAFPRVHEWDLAAGDLIVSEAGGVLLDVDGDPLTYNKRDPVTMGVVGANPALAGQICAFVAENRIEGSYPHRT